MKRLIPIALALIARLATAQGEAFWPDAVDGVYDPGVSPKLTLHTGADFPARGVTATIDVKPFGGALRADVMRVPIKPGENAFTIPGEAAYGHFTVTARWTTESGATGCVQTAFVTAPPEPKTRDPYFMVDKNGVMEPLLDAMKRFGFGTVFMSTPTARQAVELDAADLVARTEKFRKGARTGVAAREDFHVMASAGPSAAEMKRLFERAEAGLPPLTEAEVLKVRRHYERIAALLADRVDAWIVQEEIDSPMNGRSNISTNYFHYLSAWGLLARNICDGLRAGDPKCRIGMLGIYCGDYYNSTPPFAISRRMLWPLTGRFDFVALDAYSGNWNRMRNRYTPPEESFTSLLTDAAALSAEYGGEPRCANVERCAGIDWRADYDSEQAIDQADYTMRSMILSRTVTNAFTYCLHLTAYHAPAKDMFAHPEKEPTVDLGIWRAVTTDGKAFRYVPRVATAAAGTAVRLLSFTRDPKLTRKPDGTHVAIFTAPGGDESLALAAMWATDTAFEGLVNLPCAVTRVDAMGNEATLPAGETRISVSTTPFFLKVAVRDRAAVEKALAAYRVTRLSTAAGETPIVVRRGESGGDAEVTFAGPGDIMPPRAVMPEAGYFPVSAAFPGAAARFGWDDAGFTAVVTVKGKEHIQRRKTRDVTGDDCVILSFYDVSPLTGDRTRRSHVTEYIAYADDTGGHGYVWDYDRRIERKDCGTVTTEMCENAITYRIRIPWAEVLPGFTPAHGARFAFNLRCPCAASRTDWTSAPYALVLKKQKTAIFQRYHIGFLDSCRYVVLADD